MSLPVLKIVPLHSYEKASKATNTAQLSPGEPGKPNYYMTDFQEAFDPRYSLINTFGRMDPIANYQGTSRKITLGVKVVIPTIASLFHKKMKKVLYPAYEGAGEIPNALKIQRPPLVMVSYGTLICDNVEKTSPLLCVLDAYAATPSAGFTPLDSPLVRFGAFAEENGLTSVEFQQYQFRFDFVPLHSATPGFSGDDNPEWIGGGSF